MPKLTVNINNKRKAIMKKILMLFVCCLIGITVFAQKTKTVTTTTAKTDATYQFTQARMPQVWVEPMVKPLVVEVEVIQNAPTFWRKTLDRYKVESELEGKLENVYNYGIFLYTEDTKSDMIVAATYNFYTNPNRTGDSDWYIIEIKGFPAKFKNWRTATANDYEWMKIPAVRYNKKEVFKKVSE